MFGNYFPLRKSRLFFAQQIPGMPVFTIFGGNLLLTFAIFSCILLISKAGSPFHK